LKNHHLASAFLLLPIAIASNLTFTGLLFPDRQILVSPPHPTTATTLAGKNWAYTVPFEVKNKAAIQKLIQCESSGINISRPDNDGIVSDGILQFHRGPLNTMQSSTWEFFSKASGIAGSPIIPADAIRMTDWAIEHGLIHHWTCARILNL
jgi:hypothetical protein